MQNFFATIATVAVVLVTFQMLRGAAFTRGLSSVSRRTDSAAFWGSILNQCVAIALTAVVTAGLCSVDWAKIAKSSGARLSDVIIIFCAIGFGLL